MRQFRSIRFRSVLLAAVVMAGSLPSTMVATDVTPADRGDTAAGITAYLDGKAIPAADVSKYYCDDFSYPVVVCSVNPLVTAARSTLASLLTSVDYVTVFDGTYFSGAYMNISQDYPVLATIGWNDKISSFKARNGDTGTFFVDWFDGGSQWSFCCNTQQSSLGGYDNTFSSVQRT